MATYAQLQAEPWWGREIQPAPLVQLGNRLCAAHNRPRNAFGIKGDNAHLCGSHRSQEWIENSRFCTDRSYTVRSGLTAAQKRLICGFDYNPGSEALMIQLCRRLDEAVRAGRLEQVTEWYGNDDGDNRVDGYDNVRNRIATSDSSHLWHVHISFDRRRVNDEAAVRAVGDVLLGQLPEEVDMPLDASDKKWLAEKLDALPNATAAATLEVEFDSPTQGVTKRRLREWIKNAGRASDAHANTKALLIGQEAILAAVAGEDVQRVVRAELDAAATRERAERQQELAALTDQLGSALVAELREAAGDLPAEAVEGAVARALARTSLAVAPAHGS